MIMTALWYWWLEVNGEDH